MVLSNVLQLAGEPTELLQRVSRVLFPGGRVLIQVPADPAFVGATDTAAGHLLRFTREDLTDLVRACGLELLWCRPFNRLGRLGWRLNHALGVGRIATIQRRGFDLLVPLARRLDAASGGDGLSWLAVARVP